MRTLLLLAVVCAGALAQFSQAGQNAIVDAHNKLRSSIAKGTYVAKGVKKPSGSNMLKIKWNTTVAASAQKYTDTCPSGHSGAEGLGENLFWFSGEAKDLDERGMAACNGWSSEFEKYGWNTNRMDSALFDTGIGHATQMAWANTEAIGCGVKNCENGGKWKTIVVCQYKRPGNYMQQDIYKSGPTCSSCPPKTKCEESTGLCVSEEDC